MPHSHPIKIYINRRELEAPTTPMSGAAILALGGYGPEYELYELRGEHDPSGGELVPPADEIKLHNDEYFRAIPGNANFG